MMTRQPGPPASVLIADDHELTLVGVRATLAAAGDLVVCAEAATASAAVDEARRHRPALCLLDVHMPGSGITATRDILSSVPGTAVVMLTVAEDEGDLFAAIRAGAVGYLRKDMDPEGLVGALRGVLRGEAALARHDVRRVLDELRGRGERMVTLPDGRTVQLTEREREIFGLLGEGRSTRQIANRLHLAPVTVRRHVSEVVHKLQVRDREEALAVLRPDPAPGDRTTSGAFRGRNANLGQSGQVPARRAP